MKWHKNIIKMDILRLIEEAPQDMELYELYKN